MSVESGKLKQTDQLRKTELQHFEHQHFNTFQSMKIEEEIKQQKFHSGHQKALINLLYTASWLQGKQQDFFKPYKITAQQFNILRILKGQHPKSISATEIKSRMLDKNSDVSRLLDRLVAKDLISKKTCPNDKRATDVNITDAGLQLLGSLEKHQSEIDRVLSLTEEEALQLSTLLDKSRG
jgi:DNA-binding MarR family transcriptional regulator